MVSIQRDRTATVSQQTSIKDTRHHVRSLTPTQSHTASFSWNWDVGLAPFEGLMPMTDVPVKISLGSQKRLMGVPLVRVNCMVIVHRVVTS